MSGSGDREAEGENPYAKPARDLPAAVPPAWRLGRIAGWILIALGASGVATMVFAWLKGLSTFNLGAVAMMVIGVGLLKRSESARQAGIGCAGTYLVILVLGGGIVWWLASGGEARRRFVEDHIPTSTGLVVRLAYLTALAIVLWLLLHPRTRAAYQRQTLEDEAGEGGPPGRSGETINRGRPESTE